MTAFGFLILCVQVCLFQNAYSQFIGPEIRPAIAPAFLIPKYAPGNVPAYDPPYTLGLTAPATFAPGAIPYGGDGIGDISIAGRMPVAGTTSVAGQVPILGSVGFGGDVAASGAVTITGSCGCRGVYY